MTEELRKKIAKKVIKGIYMWQDGGFPTDVIGREISEVILDDIREAGWKSREEVEEIRWEVIKRENE